MEMQMGVAICWLLWQSDVNVQQWGQGYITRVELSVAVYKRNVTSISTLGRKTTLSKQEGKQQLLMER